MNTLDLQNLGLEEMNEMEVKDVEGGWGPIGLLILATILMDWDDFKSGMCDAASGR